MTLNIDENGTVYIHQGDSGDICVNGIPSDKNYKVYLAIRDLNRNPIGNEFMVYSEYQTIVRFSLPGSFTDLLKVSDDEPVGVYHYGLKICDNNGLEDTLFIAKSDYGQPNNIIVFPKIVEGNNE